MDIQVAVLVGSLSKTSHNRKIARYLQQISPEGVQLNLIDLADLPLYDRDLDLLEPQPERYRRLRGQISRAQAVIWISPEHNAAIPVVLKNAIDVCTRPEGQKLWQGKPLGIITAASAMAGGQRVGDQLRAVAVSVGMPVLPLQLPISQIHTVFDTQGAIASPSVEKRLHDFMAQYCGFVRRFCG